MTVYAVQEPHRFDHAAGAWKPLINLRAAEPFGGVRTLIKHNHVHAALITQPTLMALRRGLKDFCDDDYLLPVGDPVLIAMASMIAARENRGRVNMLRWSKERREYDVVQVVL